MSQQVGGGNQCGGARPGSGLEGLRQSPAFRGPSNSPDGHDHTNDHLALLYERNEEQLAAAIPFIRQGLERGEQCLYVADDNSEETIIEAMRAHDIDVDTALESGALSVLTPADTYRRTGEFDRGNMLGFWEDSLEEAEDEEGYTGLRAAAEMTWALDDDTGSDELVEYEAVLNSLYEDEDYVVMCQYNRERFPTETIHEVIKTHPYLVVDDTISENFYYTPPEKFFGAEDLDSKVDRMTETLREHTTVKTELQEQGEYLRELYEITASSDRSFEEKLQAIFELGCDRFDLEIGGMAVVDPTADLFEVEVTNGEHEHLAPGEQHPLSETYCQAAVSAGGIEAITGPASDAFEGKLCHDKFGVRAYLGTYLEFEETDDRTFWFVSSEPRADGFSDAERTFHHLMGQWVKYEFERRQRDRALRERTEHLDALIETTPECIKTLAADGTLLQMNPAGLDMVEADTASDVTGECVYDLIAPEHRERFREFNERICRGETGTLEFDVIGLEGTRRHMETHAAPLERPDGTTVQVALTRDVTQQKDRQAELRRTKNRFKTVFEQCNDGIFVLDPDADEFMDVNPTAAEMLGYTRDELVSRRPSDIHSYEQEQFRAFLDEVQEEGYAWSEALHCRHKDGRKIPAEIAASMITLEGRELVLSNVRYIEDRKKHERFQRDLYEITSDSDLSFDEKLERLLELGRDRFGLDMGFFLEKQGDEFGVRKTRGTDLEEGVATLCANPDHYCKRTITMDAPVGVEDTEAVGWDDDPLYREYNLGCYLGTKVTDGSGVYGSICFADTSSRTQEFSEDAYTFLDLMGQWVSYELERREREAELEETIEQLQQSNDRLKQFAYAASHDLQEPLRMVSSYMQLLENRYKDDLDGDAQEYIDFAVNGADRMRAMVDDLLAFARVEQVDGEFERVDCHGVLERVIDNLQVQIEENDAEITVESLPTVRADSEQLEQVFSNLLSNAIKYSGDEPPKVEIAVEERATRWEFAVADNGIGIDPERTDRIFEVFKRLHHNGEYSGTGIGLSLCQEIVENHGGDIWVDSEPGAGSTIFFTIPKEAAD